ncbi:pyridoxal-phosphate dependent enzyme [Corynebacterium sp. YIM 101645]|uniref:Pyridoxal-phosphate dependent enzyme n=1 Tax=Corynebacterium lemuris TaxID=1859292 RepID=A0ABT2FXB3_9CORY|nr:pyridoxal-phosphate dependent enzyme [Corynebacterium lemuris]MCS5479886.1 pyridoxal-phosphate dependent enzyme [Corynebacterium lemuris]
MHVSYGVTLADTIGNTPLVRLDRFTAGHDVTVWAKLESFNPGGSAKDRTAHAMVVASTLRPGDVVVESSSGNLGVALAQEAVLGGWTFHCVVDPRTNRSTIAHMQALGAVVHEITEPDPATGDWLTARRTRVGELLREIDGAQCLDQYSNPEAFRAHAEGTMTEILQQLGHAPDHLVVAVSTTGTVGGCLRHINAQGLHTQVTAVDAEGSVLFEGAPGPRHLPGFGAGMVPELANSVKPHQVLRISDRDSVAGARRLAKLEAILPGASGGAVAAGVEKLLPELAPGSEVVLILHDNGTRYLDTIYNDDWVEANL